jgi:hypothetical protein
LTLVKEETIMPKDALAVLLDDGDSLLAGLDSRLEELDDPYLRELRDMLAFMLRATKTLAAEQAELRARRQAVTQQLRITKGELRDMVVKIRNTVKGRMGHRDEGLVLYRVRPTRRRSRAVKEEDSLISFIRPDLRPEAATKPEPDSPPSEES